MSCMRTAFFYELSRDGFFIWVKWASAFSTQLNENWLFQMSFMRTTFSYELSEDGFFIWVEWRRLFRMRTFFWNEKDFSNELRVEWTTLIKKLWSAIPVLKEGKLIQIRRPRQLDHMLGEERFLITSFDKNQICCWKIDRWSDAMIKDEMSWWNSESRNDSRD
jgi:hypothetical protein